MQESFLREPEAVRSRRKIVWRMDLRGLGERWQQQVACDGNSARYQGSIHDGVWNEWAIFSSNRVVPQEVTAPVPVKQQGQEFFIIYGLNGIPNHHCEKFLIFERSNPLWQEFLID